MAARTSAALLEPSPTKPWRGLLRVINRLRVEIVDALDRELSAFDISAAQLFVLSSVANGEADSAAGLCKTISYDPGAMTRMIDRLQQKGLVRRVPHPEDRRAMNLELTAAGKALYPQLVEAKDRVQSQFLRGFSEEEVRLFETMLNRMLANR
jgi:DNA-binding MarR family transcriptional regulator